MGRWALEQLGLVELLGELGLNGPVAGGGAGGDCGPLGPSRLGTGHLGLAPAGAAAWAGLLDFDFQTLSLMQMYRASDALMRHRQAI